MRDDRNAVIVFVYGKCMQACEAGHVMAFVRHSFRILMRQGQGNDFKYWLLGYPDVIRPG
jgi:hypothetical protein